MRISDWSSDVCSSDLGGLAAAAGPHQADEFARHDPEFNGDEGLDHLIAELVQLPDVGDVDDGSRCRRCGDLDGSLIDGGHGSPPLPSDRIGGVESQFHVGLMLVAMAAPVLTTTDIAPPAA